MQQQNVSFSEKAFTIACELELNLFVGLLFGVNLRKKV